MNKFLEPERAWSRGCAYKAAALPAELSRHILQTFAVL